MLGKPRVLAAPVVEGTGWVNCAHGRSPIPAPATLAILGARGVGVTQCDEPHELVTPTGAALLAEFVERFGAMQSLVAAKIGYGLGTRDNQTEFQLDGLNSNSGMDEGGMAIPNVDSVAEFNVQTSSFSAENGRNPVQVLAVTHLPQVAACAHHHFVVSKSAQGGVTTSEVQSVQGPAREEEVARMLGGTRSSATSLAHAQELLSTAARPAQAEPAGAKRRRA